MTTGQTLKKLLNPFEWTQHTLDNFTSWVSLVCAEVWRGHLPPLVVQNKLWYLHIPLTIVFIFHGSTVHVCAVPFQAEFL